LKGGITNGGRRWGKEVEVGGLAHPKAGNGKLRGRDGISDDATKDELRSRAKVTVGKKEKVKQRKQQRNLKPYRGLA